MLLDTFVKSSAYRSIPNKTPFDGMGKNPNQGCESTSGLLREFEQFLKGALQQAKQFRQARLSPNDRLTDPCRGFNRDHPCGKTDSAKNNAAKTVEKDDESYPTNTAGETAEITQDSEQPVCTKRFHESSHPEERAKTGQDEAPNPTTLTDSTDNSLDTPITTDVPLSMNNIHELMEHLQAQGISVEQLVDGFDQPHEWLSHIPEIEQRLSQALPQLNQTDKTLVGNVIQGLDAFRDVMFGSAPKATPEITINPELINKLPEEAKQALAEIIQHIQSGNFTPKIESATTPLINALQQAPQPAILTSTTTIPVTTEETPETQLPLVSPIEDATPAVAPIETVAMADTPIQLLETEERVDTLRIINTPKATSTENLSNTATEAPPVTDTPSEQSNNNAFSNSPSSQQETLLAQQNLLADEAVTDMPVQKSLQQVQMEWTINQTQPVSESTVASTTPVKESATTDTTTFADVLAQAKSDEPNAADTATTSSNDIVTVADTPLETQTPTITAHTTTTSTASTVNVGNTNSVNETVKPAHQQIVESATLSLKEGKNELVVQLNPHSMGRVLLTLTSDAQKNLTAVLVAENADVKLQLEKDMKQFIRSMEQNGINVSKVSIIQGNAEAQSFNSTGQQPQSESNANQAFQSASQNSQQQAFHWQQQQANTTSSNGMASPFTNQSNDELTDTMTNSTDDTETPLATDTSNGVDIRA